MSVSFLGIENTSTVWELISVKGELGHMKWLSAQVKRAWPTAKGLDGGQSLEKNYTETKGDAGKTHHLLIERNLTIGSTGMLINCINKKCASIAKGELLMG